MNDKTTELTDQQVTEYLRRHPDFFLKREHMLGNLQFHDMPKTAGKTTSLGQRQVTLLRDQIVLLEEQLQQLTHVASSNEKLLGRWHDLTLGLFSATDLAGFFDLLNARLEQDFDADAVRIVLCSGQNLDQDLASIDGVHISESNENKLLSELMELETPYCGRLTQEKKTLLFTAPEGIASAAVVPLTEYGVLAIGSQDEGRFEPAMGVLFLDLLGKTVTWRIQQHVRSLLKQA